MILHRLTLRAFGPFPDEETVDFDALSTEGLFLLRGRTGAGKTSVLDAITFALYGDVAGERDRALLKSRHAPAEREPFVQLEFSVQGKRWRVRRTPAHERPQVRDASRWRQYNQSVVLEVFDGEQFQPVTSGVQAASDEVRGIIGLDMVQFTQVILLPQGAFAQFLHASSRDKQQLLEKLFDMRRFRQVEDYLRQAARETEQRVATLRTQREMLAATLRRDASAMETAAGPQPQDQQPDLEEAPEDQLADTVSARAQQLTDSVQRQLELQRQSLDEASEQHQQLLNQDHELRAYQKHQQALKAHEKGRTAAEAWRERVTAHHEARALRQWLEASQRADESSDQAQAEAEQQADRVRIAWREQEDLAQSLLEEDTFAQARDEVITLRAGIEQAGPLEEQVTELTADLHAVCQQITEHQQSAAAENDTVSAATVQREALESQLEDLEQLENQRIEAAEQLQAAQQTQEVVDAREREHHHAAQTAAHSAEAQQQSSAAESHFRSVSQRYLGGIAAELAAELSPGEPCLVCGSTEHPSPHTGGEAQVTAEQLDAARQSLHQAQSRSAVAKAQAADSASRVEEIREQLGEKAELSQDHAQQQLIQAQEKLKSLNGRRQRQNKLREQLTEVTAGLTEGRRRLFEATQQEQAQREKHGRLTAERDTAQQKLQQHLGRHRTLRQRVQTLTVLEQSLDVAERSAQRARQVAEQAQQSRREAQQRLTESSFSSSEQVQQAQLSDQDRSVAQAQVEAFDAAQTRLDLQGEAPEVLSGAERHHRGEKAPDQSALHQMQQQLAAAQSRWESARDRRIAVTAHIEAVQEGAAQLKLTLLRSQELAGEQLQRTELAATINGAGEENPLRMTLTAYVLAARLERVAQAASRHLEVMSEGRYQLLHDDARRGRGQQGLDLKVYDEHADDQRPASSLSGGETFMASLAMALGLAEVVQSESGGISMESLFIDEGFGSLDEATLEAVMAALNTLQGEGRRVGVVSHVSGMHRQIPSQLEILRARAGSTVRMHTP